MEMDDNSVQKVWERPWGTEEMRAQCSNWNLAGDAGLLKHIQEFSQNIIQKTHTTEVALDSLLEDMRNTSVDVQNATNALLMLSNNQFVENRVYDDCEDDKEEIEVKSDEDKPSSGGENTLVAKAAEAILLGMSVIDTKFDYVEVPASDSEGEEEMGSLDRDGKGKRSFALVLEPRNPYSVRPLPHLIGSKEFMEDDRVGLGGDDEEDEEDEEEEEDDVHLSLGHELVAQGAGHDSGSSLAGDIADEGEMFDEDEVDERRIPKASKTQAWESSSSGGSDDLEVENNVIRKKPKNNDIFGGTADNMGPFGQDNVDSDIFGKESSSEDEFIGTIHNNTESALVAGQGKQLAQKDFNDELAAKLGKAKNKKKPEGETKAKKKKSKVEAIADNAPKAKSKTPSVSSDNPFGPPKDDWKDEDDMDSIFAASDGMFSGGRGLFNDLDEPIVAANKSNPARFPSTNPANPILSDKPPALTKNKETSSRKESEGNMFGDEDDDEEDVFADILVKMKPPELKQKLIPEENLNKQSNAIGSAVQKDRAGKIEVASDSWLFDGDDDNDLLWNDDTASKKKSNNESVDKPIQTKAADSLQKDDGGAEKKTKAPSKLPAGARSFYGNGIDPFALGKKLTKELEDKRKISTGKHDADSEAVDSEKEAGVKAPSQPKISALSSGPLDNKSLKEQKPSTSSESLFDDLDDGNDLFAPVAAKAAKPKDIASSGLFEDNIFAPDDPQTTSNKFKEKYMKKKSLGGDVKPQNNLFGDAASNNDGDDDIFSGPSSVGSGAAKSKDLPKKVDKPVVDSADPLFEGDFGKTGELFTGSLGNTIFSEEDTEDDLFSGFTKKDSGKPSKSDKNAEKTERQVNVRNDVKVKKAYPPVEAYKANSAEQNKVDSADYLFGPLDDGLGSQSFTKDSSISRKTDVLPGDFLPSDDILITPENKGDDLDDIFGDPYKKLDFVGPEKVASTPAVDVLPAVTGDSSKSIESTQQKKQEKRSKFENLFDDFRNDGDILSNKKPSKSDSGPSPRTLLTPPNESKSLAKKSDPKDLFGEFDSDGDDQKFATPRGKNEIDPLFIDTMNQEEDLFSSQKPKVLGKTPTFHANDKAPELFSESDNKRTKPSSVKDNITTNTKEVGVAPKIDHIPNDMEYMHQPPSVVGGGTRKLPPRTLNLERVIPSPKPDHKVLNSSEDFLSSNDAEDDRIVEAWMKGQPPPLRDSKVENTMDEVTPEFGQSYQDYGPSKSFLCGDNEPYFGDIPTGSLLRSHGKERARIQNRRRPPSRKIRKTPTSASMSVVQSTEDEVKSEPSYTTPPSKDSIEEDRGSQETIEEWSTPEAALKSPPRTVHPRSNPLSPSTDEEQDFFDVLPVGHYPPPMDPPGPHSPFSDALESEIPEAARHEDLWDKDDSALFEDAGDIYTPQMGYDGDLWDTNPLNQPAISSHQGYIATKPPSEDFHNSKTKKSGGHEDLKFKSEKETVSAASGKDDELFADAAVSSTSTKISSKGTKSANKVAQSGSVKKEKVKKVKQDPKKEPKVDPKQEHKQDPSKLDELWGDGFSSASSLKDDIFSEDSQMARSADFEDLFQGQGDLFGSSSKTPPTGESKKVTVGSAGNKKIGKSLSKLQPKSGAPLSSLFDDDDEAEDLFSPHSNQPAGSSKASNSTKKSRANKPAAKEQITKSSIKKVTTDDSLFEDPLMVLKRKE